MTDMIQDTDCGCNDALERELEDAKRLAAFDAANGVPDRAQEREPVAFGGGVATRGLLVDPVGIFTLPQTAAGSTVGIKVDGSVDGTCESGFARLRLDQGRYALTVNAKGGGKRCAVDIKVFRQSGKKPIEKPVRNLSNEVVSPSTSELYVFTLDEAVKIALSCRGSDKNTPCSFTYVLTFLS